LGLQDDFDIEEQYNSKGDELNSIKRFRENIA
jgi:hypothetical protein